jgi:ATP-dependent RNA helicase RhlE
MPKEIRKLSDKILHNPVTVQIGMIAPTKTVSHALYPVPHALKTALVIDLLRQIENDRVIIFTRTKYRARNLARKLSRVGFRSSALQGNMSQNQRQRALGGFRKGQFDILVATDIAARGIDVSEISHVINFDMPDTVDAYIHRIGRTGRAKASGKAFTFCVPDDEAMIRKIEKTLGKKIKREYLADFDYKKLPPKQPAKSRRSNPSNRRPTNKKYRPAGKKPRTSSNKNRKN